MTPTGTFTRNLTESTLLKFYEGVRSKGIFKDRMKNTMCVIVVSCLTFMGSIFILT